ncbi:MAG: hypothetical protein AB2659_04565 [Candidatus Thiodiazotropha sp.]
MDPLYEKEQAGEDREPVSLRERLRTFLFSRYFSATLLGVAALVLVVFVTKNLHSSKTTIHEETDVNQQDLLHKESKPLQADTVAQKGETDSPTQKRSLEHWTKQSHTLPGAEVTIFEEKREPDQATQLIEYRFYFPDAFVDLSALVDGLISGFAFTKVRRLKIRRIPGVVERSFIGALGGCQISGLKLSQRSSDGDNRYLSLPHLLSALKLSVVENYSKKRFSPKHVWSE